MCCGTEILWEESSEMSSEAYRQNMLCQVTDPVAVDISSRMLNPIPFTE